MLSLKLFETLNSIGKAIRGNMRPFGGIQLIFSGDFFQLPPVGDKDDPDTQRFCFESEQWNTIFNRKNQIMLVKIFRQTDEIYATILNQIREGKIKRRSVDILTEYVNRPFAENLIVEPTKLFPTRNKVQQINNTKMASLKGHEKEYLIKYIKDVEMTKTDKLKRIEFSDRDIEIEFNFLSSNLICDKEIKIKIGSQVMCIVNYQTDLGLEVCNGSQGIVTDFCAITGCPKVKFNNGIEKVMVPHIWVSDKIPGIGVSQIPIILAWALTIHKSQGATLDAAEIDVGSGIFECGQTYVALSRVKSLNGIYLTSFDAKRIRINKKVKEYYESLDLYHKSIQNEKEEEIYVPLVFAEPIETAYEIGTTSNAFIDYQYVDAQVELNENNNANVKVIRFN
jgi:ATP-dependent DNA helicase PIF1